MQQVNLVLSTHRRFSFIDIFCTSGYLNDSSELLLLRLVLLLVQFSNLSRQKTEEKNPSECF